MVHTLSVAIGLLCFLLTIASSSEADPCSGKTGVVPDPENCSSFYVCKDGTKTDFVTCSSGLLFNRIKRTCDFNSSVDCDEVPLFSDTPPEDSTQNKVASADNVVCETDTCTCVYPSNTSCTDYYRCEGGIAYKESCAEGLYMNSKKLTCDFKDEVDCPLIPTEATETELPVTSEGNEEITSETTAQQSTSPTPSNINTSGSTTSIAPKPTTELSPETSTVTSTNSIDMDNVDGTTTEAEDLTSSSEPLSSSESTEQNVTSTTDRTTKESTASDSDSNPVPSEVTPTDDSLLVTTIKTSQSSLETTDPSETNSGTSTSTEDIEVEETASTVSEAFDENTPNLISTSSTETNPASSETSVFSSTETTPNESVVSTSTARTPREISESTATTDASEVSKNDVAPPISLEPVFTYDFESSEATTVSLGIDSDPTTELIVIHDTTTGISDDFTTKAETTTPVAETTTGSTVTPGAETTTGSTTNPGDETTTGSTTTPGAETTTGSTTTPGAETTTGSTTTPGAETTTGSTVTPGAETTTGSTPVTEPATGSTPVTEPATGSTPVTEPATGSTPVTETSEGTITDQLSSEASTSDKISTERTVASTTSLASTTAILTSDSTPPLTLPVSTSQEHSTTEQITTSSDPSITNTTGTTAETTSSKSQKEVTTEFLLPSSTTKSTSEASSTPTSEPMTDEPTSTQPSSEETSISPPATNEDPDSLTSRGNRGITDLETSTQSDTNTSTPSGNSTFDTTTNIPLTSSTNSSTTDSDSTSTKSSSCDGNDCETSTTPIVCEKPIGFYPNPEDCGSFYQCVKGRPVLSDCIGGEHFSPTELQCLDPCEAQCDETLDCPVITITTTTESTQTSPLVTTQTPSTTTRTTTTREVATTDDSSSFIGDSTFVPTVSPNLYSTDSYEDECEDLAKPYPKKGSCSRFYLCMAGRPEEVSCPEGLHFSPVTNNCENPCVAQCDTTLDCSTTEEPETTTLPKPVCPRKDFWPKISNCNYYIDCSGGEKYEEKCPYGLHFNPTKRACDFQRFSRCGEPPRRLPPSDPKFECPCESCIVPSKGSCSTYYFCLNKTAYFMQCSRGLLFDKTINTCNYAHKVDCFVQPFTRQPTAKPTPLTSKTTPSTTTTKATMAPLRCPFPNGVFKNPNGCGSFLHCSNNRPVVKNCPSELHFNSRTIRCDWPCKAECDPNYPCPSTAKPKPVTHEYTIQPLTKAIPSPTPYGCPYPNGMFRNPKDCGSFIHCSNGRPYHKSCPTGLHFNVNIQRCDWPCDAGCDTNLACPTKSPKPTPKPDPLCSCSNCLLPDPVTCTKYIECIGGVSTRRLCQRGQTFDRKRLACDWAHRVDCPHTETCPRRNGLFPFKGDCHKFVHCRNGISYEHRCPQGLHFDPTSLRCSVSSEKCESTHQAADDSLYSSFPKKWQCPSSFGFFKHESDCQKFYHCDHGTATLQECPKTLFFNSKTQTCDWERNVKCERNEHHFKRRCRSYNHAIRCASNRTYVVHSGCNMFYDCTSGKACPRSCPTGLFFNVDTLQCELPSRVRCMAGNGDIYSLQNFADVCSNKGRGQMQDPSNESCYYKCSYDRVERSCCPSNRVYNEARDQCERKRGS